MWVLFISSVSLSLVDLGIALLVQDQEWGQISAVGCLLLLSAGIDELAW